MCGFAGFFWPCEQHRSQAQTIAENMGASIAHRGPNDQGIWSDDLAALTMVHRRLSIMDLSAAGHQPMESHSAKLILSFNGEIYNHKDLRQELEQEYPQKTHKAFESFKGWKGHSDTEVLLMAIEVWGLEKALQKSVGMFALALWDRTEKTLCLARDRMGEKPLYYGWNLKRNLFLFGSELKPFKKHPDFEAEVDRGALALQMRHNAIPSPHSIYKGINKCPPGAYITLRLDRNQKSTEEAHIKTYWSLGEAIEQGQAQPFMGTEHEAIDQLEKVLSHSISEQMEADVPVGAFLSGGIDSSLVTALMQKSGKGAVKTFSIGFNEKAYNEAQHAKAVAEHLGTEHTELYVSPQDAMDIIPRLPTIYDEPFSDSSQIPTFLVSQLTSQHVTVSLSGDSGDETFGGYDRYRYATQLWNNISKFPHLGRLSLAALLAATPPQIWNRMALPISRFLPRHLKAPGELAQRFARMLPHKNLASFYQLFLTHWPQPDQLVIGAQESPNFFKQEHPILHQISPKEQLMYIDSMTYLPDDILTKVDRAAMGVSLETRVPMLDHRLLEYAWSLPNHLKARDGDPKWILKQVLYRHIPREMIERPKMGFGVPIGEWLRGPLKEWASSLLDSSRLKNEGYFHHKLIEKKWNNHASGKANWDYHLWDVLMFQAWLEQQ